ncbi:hypothetical protein ACI3ET_01210 [Ornithinimicrobium sp. LYQ121]|uniref:hypothetical protein n=1 Tax=Ornithinimicrobium sp. LYQ121 TaxID=3378801 RepID=UPI00385328A6
MTGAGLTPEDVAELHQLSTSADIDASARATLRNLLAVIDPQPAPKRVPGQYYKVTNHDGWTHVAQWDGIGFVYEWNVEGRRGRTDPRDVATALPLAVLPEPSDELFLWVAQLQFEETEIAMSDETRAQLAEISGLPGNGRIYWHQINPQLHQQFITEAGAWYRALFSAITSST